MNFISATEFLLRQRMRMNISIFPDVTMVISSTEQVRIMSLSSGDLLRLFTSNFLYEEEDIFLFMELWGQHQILMEEVIKIIAFYGEFETTIRRNGRHLVATNQSGTFVVIGVWNE